MMLFAGATYSDIIVTLIGAVAVIVPVLYGQRNVREATRKLHEAVQTNHGKRPGEYLEMIEDLMVGQHTLAAQIADHVDQDAEQFRALADQISHLEEPQP